MTITVPAAPTGPATPSGGWTVEFADGFGLPLVDGHSATNRASTTSDGKWSFLGAGGSISGFNQNEIACFNASQISQDSRGLVLTAKYAPNNSTSKWGDTYNYVSGAIQSTLQADQNGFQWMPGGGSTLVFEINCKLGQGFDGGPTNGGNDEGWWASAGNWGTSLGDEFDFFEHWGWRGPPGVFADVWVYDTTGPSTVSITDSSVGGIAKWLGSDPGTTYHTYTTVFNPNNSFDFYIDGRKLGSHAAPPSFVRGWMKLIVSYAMRNPFASNPRLVSGFATTGATREWITRYIAVYQDKNHAGQNVRNGGIAPGTVVAGTNTVTPPAAPTTAPQLSVGPGGAVTVSLASVATATSYRLYRKTSSATSWTFITASSTPGMTDSPGVGTWNYRYTAANSGGESGPSPAATVTITVAPPVAPAAPRLTASGGTVTATWTAVANASSYGLYRSPAGVGTWTLVTTTAALTASDSPGTGSWDYRITALNSGGASAPSPSAPVVISQVGPPPAPPAPTVTVAGTDVSLAWPFQSSATAYTVWRRATGALAWTSVSVGQTATAYTDTPGYGSWDYALSALGVGGESVKSAATSAVVARLLGVPVSIPVASINERLGPPVSIPVAASGQPGSGQQPYTVLLTMPGAEPLATVTGVTATPTTGGTLPAGTYTYAVTAVNRIGETTVSAEASATVGASGGVTLAWNADPGALGYGIYRRGAAGNLRYLAASPTSGYVDSGLVTPSAVVPPTVNTTASFSGSESTKVARRFTPAHIELDTAFEGGFIVGESPIGIDEL